MVEFHFRRLNREEDERKLIDIISNFKGVTLCVIVTCDPQAIVATGSFNVRKLWEKIKKEYDGERVKIWGILPKDEYEIKIQQNMDEFQFRRPNREEDERKLIDIISNFEGVTSCVIVEETQKIVATGRFNLEKLCEKLKQKYMGEFVSSLIVEPIYEYEIIQKSKTKKMEEVTKVGKLTEKLENFEMVQEDVVTKVEDIAEHKELENFKMVQEDVTKVEDIDEHKELE